MICPSDPCSIYETKEVGMTPGTVHLQLHRDNSGCSAYQFREEREKVKWPLDCWFGSIKTEGEKGVNGLWPCATKK